MEPINYTRLPIGEIHPEARKIAVAWVEGFEKIGGIEIEQKVKLASDIMNFAKAYHKINSGWINFEDEKPSIGDEVFVVWTSGSYEPEWRKWTKSMDESDWSHMRWMPVPEYK